MFPMDAFWAAETSPHGCHDSRLLLRSACSSLLGQSCGSAMSCARSRPMHRVCPRSRTASMHSTSRSGLPAPHLPSAAPTDTVPDRDTSSELDKPCLDLHCIALRCSPPATAMAPTNRNANVPLSASVLTGTNRQLLAAAHATRCCWLE